MDKSWGEYQHFPSKIFRLTVPKIFAGETLCAVSQKFSGSEKFMNRRGGSIKNFSRLFVSKCRKDSQVNTSLLFFRKFPVAKKLGIRRGSIKIFRGKFFDSQCRNHSQVNPSLLCSRKNPVAKRFMDKGGEYEDFPSEILSLTVAKIFIGESFTLGVFLGTGKVWITRGGGGSIKMFL